MEAWGITKIGMLLPLNILYNTAKAVSQKINRGPRQPQCSAKHLKIQMTKADSILKLAKIKTDQAKILKIVTRA